MFKNEIESAAASSSHNLDITSVEMDRCHVKVNQGRVEVQGLVDAEVGKGWDAILLGWALCGKLLKDITARDTQLVIPRSHDCLGVLFGSRHFAADYFQSHPGTYYLSRGWTDYYKENWESSNGLVSQMQLGEINYEYQALVEKYGEDNAQYLAQVMGAWQSHYSKACLILQDEDNAEDLKQRASELCGPKGWEIETIAGSLGLLRRWLAGDWDEKDFLTVQPGFMVDESFEDGIILAKPAPG